MREGRARYGTDSARASEGGITVEFALQSDGSGGTDLLLSASGIDEWEREDVVAGCVSVLLAMKAAVDFGVDLRNQDPARCWSTGYADN